ncbi:hypothetical protein GCM10023210_24760 [Chryseobacterium ginsengisoli]|uniref:HTH cro/C1-type domain-containing protein n=1 Tax=Chryseobacterium ginsengisoli TaxID=363853 RepID=A0ABP9MBN7_9FLAO
MEKTKLIETRKRKNISQEKMADILCIDVSNYNRREKGTAKISLQEWQKIAETLDVSLGDIYEADENMVFIFNDNEHATGNIVNNNNYNIPLSLWESQKKYIEKLEAEIEDLKAKIAEK